MEKSLNEDIYLNNLQREGDTNYWNKLYNAIQNHDWAELGRLVIEEAKTAEDIFQQDPSTEKNILHYVIDYLATDDEAAEIIDEIFDAINAYTFTDIREENFFDFVNQRSKENKFPLKMALEKKFYKVVKILIRNSADVSVKTQSLLNEECQSLMLETYDLGLKLECNSCDINNQNWWTVGYNYRYITGRTSKIDAPNDKYKETRLLARALLLSSEQRTDLMMHPLVQMFVKDKYKKYGLLIKASMMFHITWSIMSVAYIMCVNTIITNENILLPSNLTNESNVEPNIAKICTTLKLNTRYDFIHGGFSWLLLTIFLISLTKEIYEVLKCPSRPYYLNQYENIGQWIAFVALISSIIILVDAKYALVPTIFIVFLLYCFKLIQTFNEISDKYSNNFQLSSFDNYFLFGTAISTYFIPELPNWHWTISVGLYFLVPFGALIYFTIILCLVLCFPFCGNLLQMSSTKSKKYWNLVNHSFQFMGVCIQLYIVASIPFINDCTYVTASFTCAAGIAASLFLVQGQFTKTESFGVYNQMLIKGFKILIPFLFTFLPILVAYLIIFILLLPSNKNFSLDNGLGMGKIVAMLTGDLGFDDIFSEFTPSVISANIALMLFTVTVVLLLQNLLVGLTVNDLEKLQRNATAAHVANRLEVINLMERVIMNRYILRLLKRLCIFDFVIEELCVRNFEFQSGLGTNNYELVPTQNLRTSKNAPGALEHPVNKSCGTVRFLELAKSIRDGISEKKDVFKNNYSLT